MKIFLETNDKGVGDAVINDPYEPTKVIDGKTMIKTSVSGM